MYNLTNVNPIN